MAELLHFPSNSNLKCVSDTFYKIFILYAFDESSSDKSLRNKIINLTKNLNNESIDAISKPFFENKAFNSQQWFDWYDSNMNSSNLIIVICTSEMGELFKSISFTDSCTINNFFPFNFQYIYSLLKFYHRFDKCLYLFFDSQLDETLLPDYISNINDVPFFCLKDISNTKALVDNIRCDGTVRSTFSNIKLVSNKFSRVSRISQKKKKEANVYDFSSKIIFKEGWIIFYTNEDHKRKKLYCKLTSRSLLLFIDNLSDNLLIDISLTSIVAITPFNQANYLNNPPCISLSLSNGFEYYIGIDVNSITDLKKEMFDLGISPFIVCESNWLDNGIGLESALLWESEIHALVMPFTPEVNSESQCLNSNYSTPNDYDSDPSKIFVGRTARKYKNVELKNRFRGSFKVPKALNKSIPKIESVDISLFYQVFNHEILGSGQFGSVYSGINRKNLNCVAIKVIEKYQFPPNEKQAILNEVLFLQGISHRGIVRLENVFENDRFLFVVMERLSGDMLELILTQPNGRLDETITKVVLYQILIALCYLHRHDAAHCDLKPENVLLVRKDFPMQIKLCDFGYARIISDKQYRKSLVGTPAYVAPEVLESTGYNRALDIWSTGVIVYVSLSGTFPFNEDEDIKYQIINQDYMFPSQPWNLISTNAINLIKNLMQVSIRKRYTASRALMHDWFTDKKMWKMLKLIEDFVGEKYLTFDAQDQFYECESKEKLL